MPCPPWLIARSAQVSRVLHAAAYRSQTPGNPLSSRGSRRANVTREPATRSVTMRETSVSPGPASLMMRAAALTAMPAMSSPRASTSPVCRPDRSESPRRAAAADKATAHFMARPGPSKLARIPSPVVLIRRPRCCPTSRCASLSCSSSSCRQALSPRVDSRLVESTMSVNRTVARTRSTSSTMASRRPVTNSSTSPQSASTLPPAHGL
jgi:hypothetical protein